MKLSLFVLTTIVSNVVSRGGLFWPSFFETQLSATDVSARTTMKGAAKCDKHCELQNSVNQLGFERILRYRVTPYSMPSSVSTDFHASNICQVSAWSCYGCVFVCQRAFLCL